MAEQQAHSIMAGQGAQDQVILPTRIAFSICVRGIATRFGRSVVTLSGVGLGIAFLMAVISGFQIKEAMREEAELARSVDRRVAVVRSEVGMLNDKKFFVVAGSLSELDSGFVRALADRRAQVSMLGGAVPAGVRAAKLPADAGEASAVFLLGEGLGHAMPASLRPLIGGRKVLVFHEPTAAFREELAGDGIHPRKLGIDLRPDEIARIHGQEQQLRYRMYWIVGVSLLITVVGITNAMLMSVTERFREIATMKCLGALASFVVKLFLIESSLIGLMGSILGCLVGAVFSLLAYSYTFEFVKVVTSVDFVALGVYGVACIAVGVVLSVVAGIYPARVAARMIPAAALSTHV